MYRILIVEDDKVIAEAVEAHMKTWGFDAKCVERFDKVLEEFVEYGPQLVLLDLSLPFYNGFHWCSEIRKISKVPVIFLTSASDNLSIVMAVNMGGDDFVTKPFDLAVLVAKVQAMLRRTYDFSGTGMSHLAEHRGVILNYDDATLTYHGETVELTKNEFRILQVLMENKGRAVPRDVVMTRLWETDSYVDDNTLTVNVTRLRRKLEAAGLKDFVTTKKGIGYLIR